MDISNMLNPEPTSRLRPRSSLAPPVSRIPIEEYLSESSHGPREMNKKQTKSAKDAAKFEEGPTVGVVRFAPFATDNEELKSEHEKLSLFPKRGIHDYPRHIPYSSEKKAFQRNTGRDSLEVFQYTFKPRPEMKEQVVMWDYNIGLVRVTPFFKALKFAKTIPQRAIAASPGLKDLCYSITGGALAAQGYWMPFEAAKALAITFCWEIRYALTPLFGDDFPELCVTPDDPVHKRFSIDPDIVQKCKEETLSWRLDPQLSSSSSEGPTSSSAFSEETKADETMASRLRPRSERFYDIDDSTDAYEDSIVDEPPAHLIQSSNWAWARHFHLCNGIMSISTSPCLSSVPISPTERDESLTVKRCLEDTENDADESSLTNSDSTVGTDKRRRIGKFGADEMRAAHALLQLSCLR